MKFVTCLNIFAPYKGLLKKISFNTYVQYIVHSRDVLVYTYILAKTAPITAENNDNMY
jgi:hypothetical protein